MEAKLKKVKRELLLRPLWENLVLWLQLKLPDGLYQICSFPKTAVAFSSYSYLSITPKLFLHAYIWKEKKIHTFCPPFPSSIKRKWFIPISNILSLLFRKRFQNYPSLFLPLPGPLFCFPSSKPRESMVPWLLSFMHFHNTLGIMQWSVKLMIEMVLDRFYQPFIKYNGI